MSFTRISNSDFNGKGALSLPDQPTVAAQELKRKFDEPAREVVASKVNVIVDELEATTAASDLGATAPSGRTGTTVQTVMDNMSSALSNVEAVIPGLVANEHAHPNKDELDKFSEDASGKPLYDGNVIGETDYNGLDNQPQVNGVTLTGNKSASDLGLAATSDIPTKVSDLTNDSDFATTTDVATAVATKSNVAWNQIITTGQKIATVSIDGTPTDVYAPTGGGGGGGGAVDSVNGQTGTVILGVNDIDDVTLSSVAPNDALVRDASGWKNKPLGDVAFTNSYNSLDDLPDIEDIGKVNISSPADGQILKYNATSDEWQNANGGGGGGMLPYLYIDSEAGATVTVNQPDGTVITPTAAGSGHWECELTGGYGTYVIHSVLSGQGDATQSLSVDTVKEYHVTDTHYDHTVSFVAPSGSTVRIEGGTEIYTLTGTGSTQTQAVHSASTSFTVTATMDGNGKPYTFTTPSTTGQTTTIPSGTFDFGTINVTVAQDFVTAGSTITCVNGGTSCTPKTAASTLVFRVPTTGTWTISGSVGGQTYTTTATVTALGTPVSTSLQTVPEGSTVLPTDDIQTWLNCAGIYNKTSYTTLADVLGDATTLLALMSDNNAVDYLVRSVTWATDVCADSTAMTDIGANNYCANTLLADADWFDAIANSTYRESVLNIKVPTMTDFTVPSGEASASGAYTTNYAWKAFDGNDSTYWYQTLTAGNVNYEFTSVQDIFVAYVKWTSASSSDFKTMVIKGYNEATSAWDELGSVSDTHASQAGTFEATAKLNHSTNYKKYGLFGTTVSGHYLGHVITLQFYGREDV